MVCRVRGNARPRVELVFDDAADIESTHVVQGLLIRVGSDAVTYGDTELERAAGCFVGCHPLEARFDVDGLRDQFVDVPRNGYAGRDVDKLRGLNHVLLKTEQPDAEAFDVDAHLAKFALD